MTILLILGLLAQTSIPSLPSPTPWRSPTPIASVENTIDEGEDMLATASADELDFEADGTSIEFDGNEVLLDTDTPETALMFAYFKWIVSNGASEVFGPFASLLVPAGILFTFAFISLFVYFWENVIVTILKFVGWIINIILRLLGR